jgi:hypothetical protein
VFCEDVHTACDSVSISGLSILVSVERNGKVGWVGDDSHVVSGKKFPFEKGSV